MSKVMQNMMEGAAKKAMDVTAEIFGISTDAVAKILQVGIPMQQKLIAESPEKAKDLYKKTVSFMPEQVQDFYRNLAENPNAADEIIADYRAFMGASADAINAAIADELDDVSEEEVEQTMAAAQPAFTEATKAEAEAAGVKDGKGFGSWFSKDAEK